MARVIVIMLLLLVVACGGGSEESADGVASLGATTTAPDGEAPGQPDAEEALLEFSQCLREQGFEVGDPVVDADGNVGLAPDFDGTTDFQGLAEASNACAFHLEGVTLGFEQLDLVQLQDDLVRFAQCMRDNGYDMEDPDLSELIDLRQDPDAQPGELPFGIDLNDPDFQSALEVCEEVLADFGIGAP